MTIVIPLAIVLSIWLFVWALTSHGPHRDSELPDPPAFEPSPESGGHPVAEDR